MSLYRPIYISLLCCARVARRYISPYMTVALAQKNIFGDKVLFYIPGDFGKSNPLRDISQRTCRAHPEKRYSLLKCFEMLS